MLASRDFTYTSAQAAGYDFDQLYQERYKPFWEPGDSVRDTIRRREKIIKARASALLEVPGAKDWNTCGIVPRELAYRQASLLSDTSGEKLYSHEIFFLERFEAHGERATWIPADDTGQEKRPDMLWRRLGILVDVKTPHPDEPDMPINGAAISRSIRTDVFHKVTKERQKEYFLIDLGPRVLDPKLRGKLEVYNFDQIRGARVNKNEPATVKGLWVMSEDGKVLTEIQFRK